MWYNYYSIEHNKREEVANLILALILCYKMCGMEINMESIRSAEAVFKYFEKLCTIPHGSGNTKKISDYLASFAGDLGYEYKQDELNNLIIFVPASEGYEQEDVLIIQGHMDMVCEKTADSTIDFINDGLEVVNDGIYYYAKNTTLGGDDGIAIAYAMAVMADKEIKHPPLEIVFTVDEEVGMDGAAYIDLSMLKGKKLINIDSEEEGIFLTSCAGGRNVQGDFTFAYENATGLKGKIVIDGLKGGHSGCEIDKGRANSNMLMGRFLLACKKDGEYLFDVIAVNGGLKDNAIPRSTSLDIVFKEETVEQIGSIARELSDKLRNEYQASDGDVKVTFMIEKETSQDYKVLTKESTDILCMVLNNIPNGIQSMSMQVKDLVETSLNLGIVKSTENGLHISFAVRSSIESAKEYLSGRLSDFIEFLGGEVKISGDYTGWQYRENSPLREKFIANYEKLYGEKPQVTAIHAGLECGILASKIDDLDCISLGPDILDIHTVEERLNIASTLRTWNLLLHVLEDK